MNFFLAKMPDRSNKTEGKNLYLRLFPFLIIFSPCSISFSNNTPGRCTINKTPIIVQLSAKQHTINMSTILFFFSFQRIRFPNVLSHPPSISSMHNARIKCLYIISYTLTYTDEVRPLGLSFESSLFRHRLIMRLLVFLFPGKVTEV